MVNGEGGSLSPAITRAGDILDELADGHPRTVAELASRVRLAKSSVSDVCATLAAVGLARRAADGSYRLGAHTAMLARRSLPMPGVLEAFRAVLLEGTAVDGHTISLGALTGIEVLTVDVRLGRHPLPLTPRPGARDAAVDGAAGAAVVSALDPGELDDELTRLAAHQGADPDAHRAVRALVDPSSPVAVWRSRAGAQQLACSIPAATAPRLAALTLHLPHDPRSTLDLGELASDLQAAALAVATRASAVSPAG